jgi:hypothetical protein
VTTEAEPARLCDQPLHVFLRGDREQTERRLNALLPDRGPWTVDWQRDHYGRVITITPGSADQPRPASRGAKGSRRQSQALHLAEQLRAVIAAEEASR